MSDERSDAQQVADHLLAYLRQIKNDRGAMAELRRALNPSQRHRAWPLLARVNGIDDSRIETVAGLFACHPDEANEGNLGTTCRRLSRENESYEARFRRLLSCDYDEVCDRVRPVVFAARAKGIGVNYEALFKDLFYWGDLVKARWARESWGAPESEQQEGPVASEAVP